MTLIRLSDVLLLLLVAVAMAAFGVAAQVHSVWIVGVLGICAAWIVSGPSIGGRPARRGVVTALLAVVIGTTMLRTLGVGVTVELFCEFVILLIAVKVLDRRGPRDASQIATLSVFLTIGAVLTSSTLQTGLAMLVFVVALLVWSVVQQMVAARESAIAKPPVRDPRRLRRNAVGLTLATFVVGGLLAGLVFVAIPRGLASSVLGDWGAPTTAATTGFSDSVELGAAGIISESSTPVLNLELRNRAGESIGGQGQTVYLRGAVLDEYNSGAWVASATPDPDAREPVRPGSPVAVPTPGTGFEQWEVEQRITIRAAPRDRSPIFAAWKPLNVRFEQSGGIIKQADGRGSDDRLGGVIYRTSPPGKFTYTVRSTALLDTRTLRSPGMTRPFTPTFDSAPVRELAIAVVRAAGVDPDPTTRAFADDALAARAIENHLRGSYEYSLTPGRVPPRLDPIEWFLFDESGGAGHCEYFASSMAAMCRSVGVHARVITGYVAADYNDLGGHYLVKQSNAHAWVEVLVAPDRWRTYDPTPPAEFRRLHQRPSGLWTTIQRAFESLEYAWVTNVVGFNADAQTGFLGKWSPPGVRAWFDERVESRSDARTSSALVRLALLSGLGAFFVGLVLGSVSRAVGPQVRRLWRGGWLARRRAAAKETEPDDPRVLRKAHARIVRRLAKAGVPRPAHVPLKSHTLHLDGGELRTDAEYVADVLYAWRFAGISPTEADESRLRVIAGSR